MLWLRWLCLSLLCGSSLFSYESLEVLHSTVQVHRSGYIIATPDTPVKEILTRVAKGEYTAFPKQAFSLGYGTSDYWYIFELSADKPTALFLDSKNILMSTSQSVYVYEDETLLGLHHTAQSVPFEKRPVDAFSLRFPIELTQNTRLFLIKEQSQFPHLLGFAIGNEVSLEKNWFSFCMFSIVLASITLAFILYNGFIYLINREKSHLYYVLAISGFMGATGITHSYLPSLMGVPIFYLKPLLLLCLVLYLSAFVAFSIHFLELFEAPYTKLKWSLIGLFGGLIFLSIFRVFLPKEFILYAWLLTLFACLVAPLVIAFIRLRQGFYPARYYLIAISGMVMLNGSFMLTFYAKIFPYTLFTMHLTNFGMLWEVVLLSLALAYRLRYLREEQEKQKQLFLARSKFTSIGELTANIAHQWKQPIAELGAIVSHMEAKVKYAELSKEELVKQLSSEQSILQHLSQTVTTFQNFFHSKIENEVFDVAETLNNIVLFVKETMALKGINITLHVKNTTVIQGDKNALFQAILNIVINAKDALLSSQKKEKWIRLALTCKDDTIMISIENNGEAIAIKPIEAIFELFVTNKLKGSGMGLFIAKTLVESQLNGKLHVSNTNDGVCFTMHFQNPNQSL